MLLLIFSSVNFSSFLKAKIRFYWVLRILLKPTSARTGTPKKRVRLTKCSISFILESSWITYLPVDFKLTLLFADSTQGVLCTYHLRYSALLYSCRMPTAHSTSFCIHGDWKIFGRRWAVLFWNVFGGSKIGQNEPRDLQRSCQGNQNNQRACYSFLYKFMHCCYL